MVVSEGKETEKKVGGKRAAWLDYYGPVDGQTVDVLVMDYPTNPRDPTYWHTRAYGLTLRRGSRYSRQSSEGCRYDSER
jgi:hypothetical protein